MTDVLFRFAHSHGFPGCRVALTAKPAARGAAMAEFSDGSAARCRYARETGGIRMTVAAYVTQRGTAIGEKSWFLAEGEDGIWTVARRA